MTDNDSIREEHARTGRKWYFWFWIAVLLTGAMLYLFYFFPEQSIGPQQPIYFSHRVHAGVKEINCRFCHPYVERSQHAGLPTVEKCFFCHQYIIPMHPQIQEERKYLETKTPVPWVKVFILPDFVKFRHLPHIQFGKLDCTECHGDVKTMDRLKTVGLEMGFCVDCHTKKNAQLDCWLACHH